MLQENIGQTIDRYKIITLLGEGGMGSVYKAFDQTLTRDVALKVMHAQFAHQTTFQDRFLQEARTAARLNHPGIVQVYDFGANKGMLYIVMEFIPGSNLGQILRELRTSNRWLPLAEGVSIIRQVALALDYAHQHGVLHRDIKPDNIMLKPEPQGDLPFHPVITDLGLAKLVEGGIMTQDGTSMGTPAYMSPEQALGQPTDARSDVYSLGILLYELSLARLPFPARSLTEAIRYHTQEPPPPPRSIRPDLPESLEAVILKALQKDVNARYASAGDLARALQGVLPAATQVVEQKASLGETVSLVTVYQQSLAEPRGPSILNEFDTFSGLQQDQVQVLNQGKTTLSVPIKTSGMVIGRDEKADIFLNDSQVSRSHARITIENGQYYITDLESTNGTFIDNAQLLPGKRELWSADKAVRIAGFWLRLALAKEKKDQTAVENKVGTSTGTAGPGNPVQPTQATLQLESSAYSVDPGSVLTVPLTVTNQGELVDQYSLGVNGIPDSWLGSLPGRIDLLPGESRTAVLTINPPRNSTARANTYPVQVTLKSNATGQTQVAGTFRLNVNPFYQFTSTLHPERICSGKPARLAIQNQGGSPQHYTISWQDRSDELVFRPPQTQMDVPEGQSAEITFTAVPRERRWFGGEKIHPFSLLVSTSQESQPRAHNGEFVSSGRIPVWVLPALMGLCALFALLATLGFGQYQKLAAARTQQTQVALLAATGQTATANAPVIIPVAASATIAASPTPPAPTAVNTPIQTMPAQPTPLPPTPTAAPLVMKILHPLDSENPVTKTLIFQVQAFDSASGTQDGAGITNVEMRILDHQGNQVYTHIETKAGFCAFGGGEPDCTPFVFANSGYRWDKGQPIQAGEYTLQAVAHAASGRTASVETKVTIQPLKRIAFINEQNSGRDIYTIYEDGSDQNQLTKGMNVSCCLNWSPNGTTLAFTAKKDGYNAIYTVDADGSKVKPLTHNQGGDSSPIWSPDGKHIAFLSARADPQINQLFMMDADGSNQTPLTNSPGNKSGPSWSPDSKRIAYSVDQGNSNFDIFVINRDGSGGTQLTNDPSYDAAAAWSPDGKFIAFISERDNRMLKLFLMNSDGSNQHELVTDPVSGVFAAWSTDSQQILYYSQGSNSRSLSTVNPDGANIRPVTPPSVDAGAFSWSADNRQLAISSGYDIVVVRLENQSTQQLTHSPGIIDDDPAWQPQ